jgi:NAD(P)-dependent dehydrogenase (short-subunit alcohol dehydrogenase family)
VNNYLFESFKLNGKACLVTGASRGLGRAMAIALGQAGADLILTARDETTLAETAAAIRELGQRVMAFPCDLHDSQAITEMVDRAIDEFGQIDVLINNAGGGAFKPLLETSEEEWLRILDININSMFKMCKSVGPHMIKRRYGKIINMSSMYGLVGEKNLTSYCVSKGAIIQLTRALALEWAEYNINVNVLTPGFIYTDLTSYIFDNPETNRLFTDRIPLRRIGKPEELGPLVIYLASDASNFMTGSVITIDGGQTAQ